MVGRHRHRTTGIVLVAGLALGGCTGDDGSCGFDAAWKFPKIDREERAIVTKAVMSFMEDHPGDLDVSLAGDGRLFCEVDLLDVRDGGRVAYGRAVCQVYSRDLVDGQGLGTPFRASLVDDGKRVEEVDLPEGMGSDYAENEAKLVPDDLEDDMCQIGFARGEDPSVRDKRERQRAREYFDGAQDE